MSIENTPSSRGKIPLLVGAEREELLRRTDIARALAHVVNSVPRGSYVTIEGTPMYFGNPWNRDHEFGTNVLLPGLANKIEKRGSLVDHYALLDDYTVDENGPDSEFVDRMRRSPDVVSRESEFEQPARESLQMWRDQGRLRGGIDGELYLGDIRVQTRSGIPSCPLLDAWFQLQKMCEPGYHIVIHPKSLKKQQREMRALLGEIAEGFPGEMINLYFKRDSVSQVFRTGYDGTTHRMEINRNERPRTL